MPPHADVKWIGEVASAGWGWVYLLFAVYIGIRIHADPKGEADE